MPCSVYTSSTHEQGRQLCFCNAKGTQTVLQLRQLEFHLQCVGLVGLNYSCWCAADRPVLFYHRHISANLRALCPVIIAPFFMNLDLLGVSTFVWARCVVKESVGSTYYSPWLLLDETQGTIFYPKYVYSRSAAQRIR